MEGVKVVVANDGNALEYAEMPLKGDVEVVKFAVAKHVEALRYAKMPAKGDVGVLKEIAVVDQGLAPRYAANARQVDDARARACVVVVVVVVVYRFIGIVCFIG